MPDLLLELFSEEIPARMQVRAAEDLRKAVTDRLVDAGFPYDGAKKFVTPRRLALAVQGVPVRQPDRREEKKGPRVGAPEQAIAGFLKAAGLKSLAEAKVQPDKKGDFYVAVIEKPGRPAVEVIAEILPQVIRDFPWPKSMRWGAQSARQGTFAPGFQSSAFDTGPLRWVRPLHSIVATFGPETEEPDVVPFTVDGIAAGNQTRGHRFLAPDIVTVRHFADYCAKLDKAKVVLDPERRREIILTEAKQLAFAQGLELVEDQGLLAETAGLVDWPANWRHWSAPTKKKQNARRGCVKLTCSRKWSANFPSCKARWGSITRKSKTRTKRSRMRSRIIIGRRAPMISCRAIRSRLRSRFPTSSIPWSGFGRSARSRPAARIRMHCDERRWA